MESKGGDHRPAGCFLLRCPVLPFDDLLEWADGALAPGASSEALQSALARDRRRLREGLVAFLDRPEVGEALFLASSSLYQEIEAWRTDPESKKGGRVERALVHYLMRMGARPTPFGFLATVSAGRLDAETDVRLASRADCRVAIELDAGALHHVVDDVRVAPAFQRCWTYRLNGTLTNLGDRIRYYARTAARSTEPSRFELFEIESDEHLQALVGGRDRSWTLGELTHAVRRHDPEVTESEAERFVGELVAAQVLEAEVAPPLLEGDPLAELAERMEGRQETQALAGRLRRIERGIRCLREASPRRPADYETVSEGVRDCGLERPIEHLFHVDVYRPLAGGTLAAEVATVALSAVEAVSRLCSVGGEHPTLRRFRERMADRFGTAEIPLNVAVDDDAGVGFPAELGSGPTTQVAWGPREGFLHARLCRALSEGEVALRISRAELDELPPPANPLPDAFAVCLTLAARSERQVRSGRFELVLHRWVGPSGARLLARHCRFDEDLRRSVEEHLRQEEALAEPKVLVEVTHVPDGPLRTLNLIQRTVGHRRELVLPGGTKPSRPLSIPLSDLVVSVQGDEIVLRSVRWECEVAPRLNCSHNFSAAGLKQYRFLGLLQEHGTRGHGRWSWGPLAGAPFLPRVVVGRSVLSRATWTLSSVHRPAVGEGCPAQRFAMVQELRSRHRLPRWIDCNGLTIDLDNALCVESFGRRLQRGGTVSVQEMYPGPEGHWVEGPEGRYRHDLIVPLVRARGRATRRRVGKRTVSTPAVERSFPPGSSWLSSRIFVSRRSADDLLRMLVQPLVEEIASSGLASRWFFLRYGDPHWHLRLRFAGDQDLLVKELLPRIARRIASEGGAWVWRWEIDTYQREVERYGGPEGIGHAEDLFWTDSECALELIHRSPGARTRRALALYGIDRLLSDFGLQLREKLAWVSRAAGAGDAARLRGESLRAAARKLRWAQRDFHQLLDDPRPAEGPFTRRSERIRPVAGALRALDESGRLTTPVDDLLLSFVHTHVNRLVPVTPWDEERELLVLLARIYRSRLTQNWR